MAKIVQVSSMALALTSSHCDGDPIYPLQISAINQVIIIKNRNHEKVN